MLFLDTFTDAQETPLDEHTADTGQSWLVPEWIDNYIPSFVRYMPQISNNKLIGEGDNEKGALLYLNGSPGVGDYRVSADVVWPDGNPPSPGIPAASVTSELVARLSPTGSSSTDVTFYSAGFVHNGPPEDVGWYIESVVGGYSSGYLAFQQASPTIGQTYELLFECVGNKLRLFVNGDLVLSAEDSNITNAGYGGVLLLDQTWWTGDVELDNFRVQTVSAVAPPGPNPNPCEK